MTAPREIIVSVAGTEATFVLTDDLSPKATQAFWDTLPVETTLIPAKWSGRAAFFMASGESSKQGDDLEYPVCSIYPGYLVMRAGGSEFLIAYGQSEYRWGTGTDYVTPLARVTEGYQPFINTLASMHNEGEKPITIRRARDTTEG